MQFEKSQTSSPTELQTFIKRLRNTWQEDPCGNESKRSKSTWPGFCMAFLTAKAPGGVRKDTIRHYSDLFHFIHLHSTSHNCQRLFFDGPIDPMDPIGPGMGRAYKGFGKKYLGHGRAQGLGVQCLHLEHLRPKSHGFPPQLKQNTYRILIESYIDLV